MAISRRLRYEILRRDNFTCRYCGASAPDTPLTVDHVIPVALGGGDEPSNLVTACQACNVGKSSTNPDSPLVEDVDAAALLFAKAIERAAAVRRQQMDDLAAQVDHFDHIWSGWTYGPEGEPVPKSRTWRSDIERFLVAGLELDTICAFIVTAMESRARDEWKYFCKVCWNELSTRQELARQLIENGEV